MTGYNIAAFRTACCMGIPGYGNEIVVRPTILKKGEQITVSLEQKECSPSEHPDFFA